MHPSIEDTFAADKTLVEWDFLIHLDLIRPSVDLIYVVCPELEIKSLRRWSCEV